MPSDREGSLGVRHRRAARYSEKKTALGRGGRGVRQGGGEGAVRTERAGVRERVPAGQVRESPEKGEAEERARGGLHALGTRRPFGMGPRYLCALGKRRRPAFMSAQRM